MPSSRRFLGLMTLVVAAAACADGDRRGPDPLVVDSAGVRIVSNFGPDSRAGVQVREVALLIPPDSALTAFPWSVTADPRAGQAYVADQSSARVLVFGENGEYLRTLGREGEGPGEFVSPNAVALAPTGGVAVWDVGRNVLSSWSVDGELLSEEAAPVSYWGPGFALESNAVVAVTSSTSDQVMQQQLVRVSESSTAVLHSVPRSLEPVELPCGTFPISPIYSPSMVWTDAGDGAHALNGPAYRIDRYVGGSLVGSIRRDLEPVRITEALASERASMELGGFLRSCGLTPQALVQATGRVESASPIQALSVDPSGRLWVSRSLNGLSPVSVDVFSGQGRYDGTVQASAMPVAWLGPTRFVGFAVRPDTREVLVSIQEVAASPDP